MGIMTLVVTLIMAPIILTANSAIGSANITNLTGMSSIDDIGPIVIILGMLASAGLFAWSGAKGGSSIGRKDMMVSAGTAVAMTIALTMFIIVIDGCNTLYTAAAGSTALQSFVGIIPLLVYVGIIVGAGAVQYRTYKRTRRSRGSITYGSGISGGSAY